MKTELKENKKHILPGAISNKNYMCCPGREGGDGLGQKSCSVLESALYIGLETSLS